MAISEVGQVIKFGAVGDTISDRRLAIKSMVAVGTNDATMKDGAGNELIVLPVDQPMSFEPPLYTNGLEFDAGASTVVYVTLA